MFHFECDESASVYLDPVVQAECTLLVVLLLLVVHRLRGSALDHEWHMRTSLAFSALAHCSVVFAALEVTMMLLPLFSWLLAFVNIAFFMRSFVQETELVEMMVETWMLIHTCLEWYMGLILPGYRFLVVARLLYSHMMGFTFMCVGRRLYQAAKALLAVLVGLMLVAGTLQLIEDGGERCTITNEQYPFLTYVYMVGVTLSTVGYGEFYPVTPASKITICFAILVGTPALMYYLRVIRLRVRKVWTRTSIPPMDSRPRLALLCSEGYDVHKLVTSFNHLIPTVDVVVIVDTDSEGRQMDKSIQKVPVSSETVSPCVLGRVFSGIQSQDKKLVLLNDTSIDALSADMKVIRFATMAMKGAMDVGIVAQVRLQQTRAHLENMKFWDTKRNSVVCTEEITMGLMAKTMVAPGVNTMFCNMLYPLQYKMIKNSDFCANNMLEEFLDGENFKIFSTSYVFQEEESFANAAIKCAQNGGVLIGCWNDRGLWLLPKVLPKDTHRIFLSHPDDVNVMRYPNNTSNLDCISQSTEFYAIRDKVVVRVKDRDPCLLSKYLQRYPQVVISDDEPAYTMACLPFDFKTVGSFHKKSPQARLVSNVRRRPRCFLDDELESPFWHDTFVNEDVLLFAVMQAYKEPDLYNVWAKLVESPNIVEVDVKENCSAIELLQALLEQDLMLLGVNAKLTSLCNNCQATRGLSAEHPVSLPITSPSKEFLLTSGDKAIAIRIGFHPQLDPPSTTKPFSIAYASNYPSSPLERDPPQSREVLSPESGNNAQSPPSSTFTETDYRCTIAENDIYHVSPKSLR